ncbi:hypothetical protein Rumeso_01138 [Rubellimicrobium mesophilum DSM 19309]|uniref:Uncharacterized protein n=1 Tax=Rubellimicrobium mesophilum DSM 19309 TaxID=442562 RepID=A0A017HS29_9RHOB|nr:hypothetical protein Rumeso_01138 [Rubellimicrobium mesophilum DSM 19309]
MVSLCGAAARALGLWEVVSSSNIILEGDVTGGAKAASRSR